MSNRFERHPRIVLTVAIIAVVFFLLGLTEGIARVFLPQWAPMTAERSQFWRFDSLLGWHHIPDKTALFSHPNFSVSVSINADGLRDRDYEKSRNKKNRMLVLGDSFGWGFGVQNQEVFSELLEANHPDWEIINASVSGYGTVQEYLYYRDIGFEYKPDVVLLLFHDNDFQDNTGKTGYWYNKPLVIEKDGVLDIGGLPVPERSAQQRLQTCLLGNFYLGRILYPILVIPFDFFSRGFSSLDPGGAPEEFPATTYMLNQLAELASTQNARLVIVETPLSKVKQSAVEASCQQYRLSCLHLEQAFRLHSMGSYKKEPWHFEHDPHWNANGHRIAAEAIDDFFSRADLW